MGDSESAVPLPRLVCTVQAALCLCLPGSTTTRCLVPSSVECRCCSRGPEPISCPGFRKPPRKYTCYQKSIADFLSCLTEPSNTMARGANVVIVG
jgi:hypothetical protein